MRKVSCTFVLVGLLGLVRWTLPETITTPEGVEGARRSARDHSRRSSFDNAHTHGGGELQVLDNLQVLTGEARHGQPVIQRVFEIQ